VAKRILCVDDDPWIRGIYESLPRLLGPDYRVITASSGREALDRIDLETFDVVVSDLIMPVLSGAEFLAKVAEIAPGSARVVVSGFADEITIAKCLLAAHRYFTKPFDPPAFSRTIQALNKAQETVRSGRLRDLVGKFEALPTPSEKYLRLMRALNARDRPLSEIAGIVEEDPSLTAKVLQAVNSAMFGRCQQVCRLEEALQIIGVHVLRALVLTIQVFDFYRNPALKGELREVSSHSARVARLAGDFCTEKKWSSETREEAFLAGLLHDVGRIILLAAPEAERAAVFPDYRTVHALEEMPCPLAEAIEAEAGAYLLSLWGIPESIVEAVRSYRTSSLTGGPISPAVRALIAAHDLDAARC
jgi:HD-like signal output (HDOD) protein